MHPAWAPHAARARSGARWAPAGALRAPAPNRSVLALRRQLQHPRVHCPCVQPRPRATALGSLAQSGSQGSVFDCQHARVQLH
eukprot:7643610-Lingulodinium_polyedra.AAC.1